LVDEKVEKAFNFHLSESLSRAHRKRLFTVSADIFHS